MKPRREQPKVVKPRTQERPKRGFRIRRLEERIAPKGGHRADGGGGPTGL
jgi:hypothetical protein